MKTLYTKLTPRPGTPQERLGITWFVCAELNGGPAKTLQHVQRTADKRQLGIDYELIDFLEYATMRATQTWLYTEPGNEAADKEFKLRLVRAGLFQDTSDIIGFVCDGVNDHAVQVVGTNQVVTINTKTSTMKVEPIPVPASEVI